MKCIFCSSAGVVRNGRRKRKVRLKQSYLCMNCNRQFVEVDGFERMRHKPKIIARAIHMHQDGMSFFRVQAHLWQHDGVKISRQTLWEWEKKYSDFLKSAARRGKSGHQRKSSHG